MFENCDTPQAVKSEYRRLAKIHHPDVGGDTGTMQRINALYHELLSRLSGFVSVGSDGREHTYRYNADTEQAIMDKVFEILSLGLHNLDIEIVGLWVWVSGSTKDQKDLLNRKGAGLKWHTGRNRWYWKPYAGKTRYNKNASFEDLKRIYGARSFKVSESDVTAA